MDILLSWVGAIISIIGTAITIYQVKKAKSIKDEIYSERKKLSLKNAIEELKKSQPYIRQLLHPQRGVSLKTLTENIHSAFDISISSLNVDIKNENDIRKIVKKAQKNLNNFLKTKEAQSIEDCQSLIQDCISKITNILNKEEIQ